MNNQFNTQHCQCPVCTYPLSRCYLGTERDKKGVIKEIIRTYCSNRSCSYEKISRRRAKWQ